MQFSLNLIHSHFTLCFRARDYIKWLSNTHGTAFGWEVRVLIITRSRLLAHVWSDPKGHFTHETESPVPLHFKHSHWWKRRSWPKLASHYAGGTNGVCECKMNVKSAWILYGIEWITFHGHLDYFQKPSLGRRPNTKHSQRLVSSILSCVRTRMNRDSSKRPLVEDPVTYNFTIHLRVRDHTHYMSLEVWHLVEDPVTYDFTIHLRVRDHTHYMSLEVCWDGLWTLYVGLPQLHGHGSWLVCEVALSL